MQPSRVFIFFLLITELIYSSSNFAAKYECKFVVNNDRQKTNAKFSYDGSSPINTKLGDFDFSVDKRDMGEVSEAMQISISTPIGTMGTIAPMNTPWVVAVFNRGEGIAQASCKQ